MLLPTVFRPILEILRAPQNAMDLPAKISGGMVSPCRAAARGFIELMRSEPPRVCRRPLSLSYAAI